MIMNELGLTKIQNSLIGGQMKKVISGGEKKRTAIGVEMITDPSLLLLDEPTSGLDSFKATSVVRLLKRFARDQGKTVIATIHQPGSDAFKLFDKLILMQDGNIVYQGLASESSAYFRSMGIKISTFANPADVFMRSLAVRYPKKPEDQALIDLNIEMYNVNLL